jgi:hypothetical protein
MRPRDIGRRLRGGTAIALVALTCAGAASAADIGANDDTGKYAMDGGTAFYARMAALGLRQTVITVRWAPSDPLGLSERKLLDAAVASATAAGLKVVFATYPYPPRDVQAGLAKPARFAAWLAALARDYPVVRQFVVGNEPNQSAFFRPQFVKGKQVSAARFGRLLAAAYDALKAVDPAITIVGVGLAPRGNDRPSARSNVSTSPVRFIAALGRWYRSSGRERPLMDGFSHHPYPAVATDPLEFVYAWPHAGFANLDRIKQSLWDAFAGTPQPTTVNGLRLYLDEVGWQVDTSDVAGYIGRENVPVTDEETQAAVYGELVRRAACDPDIAQVNVFGFVDDTLRTGFQAALHRADGTPRPSAAAVSSAITEPCVSSLPAWRPATGVIGARRPKVSRSRDTVRVVLAAREGAVARVCPLAGRPSREAARRALSSARTTGCVWATITPRGPVTVTLPWAAGTTVGVRVAAEVNAARSTISLHAVS